MTLATGNPAWDAAGSISIGVLLVVVAVLVGVQVKSLLIGQSVESRILERMREHLAGREEIDTVYNLLTQQMGRDVMVAVKARMRPAASAAALIEAINRVERSFREAFPAGAVALLRARRGRLSGSTTQRPRAAPPRGSLALSRTGRPGRRGSAPAAS
jgi:divalent metal cation (Fe/Co/Zn/Cd) transporter